MPVDWIHSGISFLYLSIWFLIAHMAIWRRSTAELLSRKF
jgi:hypothetical protein